MCVDQRARFGDARRSIIQSYFYSSTRVRASSQQGMVRAREYLGVVGVANMLAVANCRQPIASCYDSAQCSHFF